MSPGRRVSSALAVRRCLVILRRLLRGPATHSELIDAVREELGFHAYPGAPQRSLEHDVRRLRNWWNVEIHHERRSRSYLVTDVRFSLLDLPDEAIEALAFLYHNFPPTAPHGDEVRQLLDRVAQLLPAARRRRVQELRTIPDLDLTVLDQEEVPSALWSTLEEAVVHRRQLSFVYQPARGTKEGSVARLHWIEPYGVEFRDGHYYLEGFCLRVKAAADERKNVGTLSYRVSRIVPGTARMLPGKLPPGRRPARTYTIRYRLGPAIAQGRVTPRFPATTVHPLPDGSAEVEAQTADLWRARQVLLRYGEHCRVLEPAELVEMMRETVRQMAELYEAQNVAAR